MVHERSLGETKTVRKSFLKVSENDISSIWNEREIAQEEVRKREEQFLINYSLSSLLPIVENFMTWHRVGELSSHFLYTLKMMHSLHLCLFNLLEHYAERCLSI